MTWRVCRQPFLILTLPLPYQLEEIVDVRRCQTDLEVTRVRDHHELLSMGHRIESGNAVINRELAQQGATIAQVLRGIHVRPPHSPFYPSVERASDPWF